MAVTQLAGPDRDDPNKLKLRRMNDLWSEIFGTPELDRRRLK